MEDKVPISSNAGKPTIKDKSIISKVILSYGVMWFLITGISWIVVGIGYLANNVQLVLMAVTYQTIMPETLTIGILGTIIYTKMFKEEPVLEESKMKKRMRALKDEVKKLFLTKLGLIALIIANLIWALPWAIPLLLGYIGNNTWHYTLSGTIFLLISNPLIPMWFIAPATAIFINSKIFKNGGNKNG